jgi:hypothetical protein
VHPEIVSGGNVPATLAVRMQAAFAALPSDAPRDRPGRLRAAALDCLRRGIEAGDARVGALDLLAADALLTEAAAAAAEGGPEAVATFAALCAEDLDRIALDS